MTGSPPRLIIGDICGSITRGSTVQVSCHSASWSRIYGATGMANLARQAGSACRLTLRISGVHDILGA